MRRWRSTRSTIGEEEGARSTIGEEEGA